MLENINIIDYKCFKDFKLDGIKRINIISGGNNVGKTALLEALFIENSNPINALRVIAINRDIKEKYFQNFIQKIKYSIASSNKDLRFEVKKRESLNKKESEEKTKLNGDYEDFYCLYCNEKLILTPLVQFEMKEDNEFKYINSSKPSNQKLIKLYSKIQTLGWQHKFLKYLQLLDSNIQWLEPQLINDELVLRVNLANPEISLITSELGEGVNRYIEILATLLSNSGQSIFIDEFENGLHYSKLLDIAKAIIEIAEEDIQVFITTHDKETIEAFAKASEELSFKDISSIELYKDDENIIHPIVMDYDNIIDGIEMGEDFR